MTSKLLWGQATCIKKRYFNVKTSAVRFLASANDKSKQITDSFKIKPTHKAVGTFGSLTVVSSADRAFKVEEPLCRNLHSSSDSQPLVVILGWAGATHKVKLLFT